MHRTRLSSFASFPFLLIVALFGVLWLAGGASRPDVGGQIIARGAAIAVLVLAILFGERPTLDRFAGIAVLLVAALALLIVQLVPLPPAWWLALPGREPFAGAAQVIGAAQPWRPISLVPDATFNAAASLLIPIATLVLVVQLGARNRARLPALLLVLMAGATAVGLLEFSGADFGNPLINDTPGQVSGTFANRNHFALFLAMGCAIAPVWAFPAERRAAWRVPVALGLVVLFALTILATGSRAGMAAGGLAIVLGLVLIRQRLRRRLGDAPRWALPALVAAAVAIVAVFVLASIAADRAVSIDRAFALDSAEDMRSRGLPTVLAMIAAYFPIGSGFGGFDPMFRMHEPFELLKPTYFNHAHNDFLEVALDGGLAGVALLIAGVGWWLVASVRAWRGGADADLARLGSVLIGLLLLASVVDYPGRTPMMMAILVVAAAWLADTGRVRAHALPKRDQ